MSRSPRSPLDSFLDELEDGLVGLTREASIDLLSPQELVTVIIGCIVTARQTAAAKQPATPVGTQIIIGPGHIRAGRLGTIVGVSEAVGGVPARYQVSVMGLPVPVTVPVSMCLPPDTPPLAARTRETVERVYDRLRAQAAQTDTGAAQ